ncbi:hypothetical protein [Streptomyces sp. NPDC017529]|uniref:hypothetical protein n=1 Tax=Streptomyces sp. NPDC017529 TaxID=3365000 RepID=UPI0037A32A4D
MSCNSPCDDQNRALAAFLFLLLIAAIPIGLLPNAELAAALAPYIAAVTAKQ